MEPVVNLTPTCGLQGSLIKAADIPHRNARDVYAFLGIPYAEPPTGELRFSYPRPITLWKGIRDATQFGAVCPQNLNLVADIPFPVEKPTLVSEDCLSLNVWTSSVSSSSKFPVMLYIHGGGFNTGFSNLYIGRQLAAVKEVVVVVINYRVGALGFLCTNDSAAAGNYGILDQIEALKWVQQHIVHFGGDPDNVTVFGESAGGMSASLLVLSPLAKGLFRRAISESGNVLGGDVISCPPEKSAKMLRSKLAEKFPDGPSEGASGWDIVEFLRKQPAEDVAKLGDQFYVVIDGHVLPAHPLDMYSRSAYNQVELLLGCNSDEGEIIINYFASQFGFKPLEIQVENARSIISSFIPAYFSVSNVSEVVDAALKEYLRDVGPDSPSDDVHRAVIDFMTDVMFAVPTIKTADYHSRTCKTYLYHFCHHPTFAWFPEWVRADHGTEVFFILEIATPGLKMSAEDKHLSNMMMSYWYNFAKTGNPNGDGLVDWPEYNETTKEHLILELPVKSDSRLKQERFNFWQRFLWNQTT